MSMHTQDIAAAPGVWTHVAPKGDGASTLIAGLLVTAVTLVMMALHSVLMHWFVVPVSLAGILIGRDAVRWFRGGFEVLDMRGLMGIVGLHFFWFSALLIPVIDMAPYPFAGVQKLDFRPWLGVMGILNVVGILMYQWIAGWLASKPYNKPVAVRRGVGGRMGMICAVAIVAGVGAQTYLLLRYGLHVKTAWGEERQFMDGQGVFVILRSSLPVTLMFAVTCIHLMAPQRKRSVMAVVIVMVLLTGLSLFLNGLTGNRGSTAMTGFWVAGIIHYCWRPFKRREVVVLAVLFVMFMFVYMFYKQYGTQGLKIFLNEGAQAAVDTGRERIDRNFGGMLVGDLSRSHLHAYAAMVFIDKPYPYDLWWGMTVPADVMTIIPRWLFPNEYNVGGYSGKHVAGTDMIRGPDSFDPTSMMGREPRMWGVAGNMMLNFGLYSAPFGYALLGLYVGWAQRVTRKWQATGDIRIFLAPLLTLIAMIILVMDPQVFTMYFLRYFALPIMIVWAGSAMIGRFPLYAQSRAG